jgi:hypothetical protein
MTVNATYCFSSGIKILTCFILKAVLTVNDTSWFMLHLFTDYRSALEGHKKRL